MKMTGKLSILIFLCKTNCGSIQYNSGGGRVSNKSYLVSPSCRKMSDFKNVQHLNKLSEILGVSREINILIGLKC